MMNVDNHARNCSIENIEVAPTRYLRDEAPRPVTVRTKITPLTTTAYAGSNTEGFGPHKTLHRNPHIASAASTNVEAAANVPAHAGDPVSTYSSAPLDPLDAAPYETAATTTSSGA